MLHEVRILDQMRQDALDHQRAREAGRAAHLRLPHLSHAATTEPLDEVVATVRAAAAGLLRRCRVMAGAHSGIVYFMIQ
jgi:hypothetical protein